jgi:hypothetical protein
MRTIAHERLIEPSPPRFVDPATVHTKRDEGGPRPGSWCRFWTECLVTDSQSVPSRRLRVDDLGLVGELYADSEGPVAETSYFAHVRQ